MTPPEKAKAGPANPYAVDPDASVEWLELVVTLVTIAALTAVFLLLPRIDPVPPWLDLLKACLPNAITALVVVPVVFFVLKRAGLSSEQKLYKAISAALHRPAEQVTFPNDVAGFAPEVLRLAAALPPTEPIVVRILAFTGTTFTTALLRDLVQRHPGRLSIELMFIDFAAHPATLFPAHWKQEARDTEVRLAELCRGKARLQVAKYPAFPFVLGLQLGESDLFVAFPRWAPGETRIADRTLNYTHFRRDAVGEVMFELFGNWHAQPGRQVLVDDPGRA